MGLTLYSLSALGCALAGSFPQLLLSRLVQGVGLGFFGPALPGLVAGLRHRERAFALYRTAQVMGGVVGPVVGGVVSRSGLGKPFLLSAGASGLAVVAAFLLREEAAEGKGEERIGFLTAARTIIMETYPRFLRQGFRPFNPLELAWRTEEIVTRGDARKYTAFYCTGVYGGISTGIR